MNHLVIGLFATAVSTAVVFGYLVFIWWLDRYEREPFWVVLLAFLWGGIGGTFLGCVGSLMLSVPMHDVVPSIYSDFAMSTVVAPVVEEFTKGLIFAILLMTPYLDNETDGLIYGAAAGLGFAAVENLLYFAATASAGPEVFYATVVVRTLFTTLIHAISTALLGYAIGYVRHRPLWPKLWMWPLVGFGLAVVNHAIWNAMAHMWASELLDDEMTLGAIGLAFAFVFFMALAMFVICQLSLMREQRVIADYLAEEADRGTLPVRHAEIIPSWRKRRRRNWLPEHIPHEEYVEAATMLAFRRYQADTAAERYRARYHKEAEEFRDRVRKYLSRK